MVQLIGFGFADGAGLCLTNISYLCFWRLLNAMG